MGHSEIANMKDKIEDFSDNKRRLILEILTYGDEKVFKQINDNSQVFLDLIDTCGDEAGAKWDDLIIKFEWTFEMKNILTDSNNGPVAETLERAAHELKY